MYGNIEFGYGDYLIVPRGTIYQMEFDGEQNRLFIVESSSPIITPNRYRNNFGQLMEHSPFCERDIRKPAVLETYDDKGDYPLFIKKQDQMYPYHYKGHPFNVIGWDGYLYPYAFSIHDFEPITGRVHQPPPVHQTFAARGFVVCSFVPRLYDYHPLAIPAPYNHSNIDSDEVLYYVDGEFMSRKHVEKGQITLHPGGIPHGPHPGTVEKSIGAKGTEELAVMVDTFKPLLMTNYAADIEDEDYYLSWL
jgi:homogentisate 1,2-dioxygenase